jgi:hypothetical protein
MTSRFTPEARTAILARVELGVSFNEAAQASGIAVKTAKGWLARGRKEKVGDYADFARAIDEARHAAIDPPRADDRRGARPGGSQMARKGSVQAGKLRWEMLRSEEVPDQAKGDIIDELEAKRPSRT